MNVPKYFYRLAYRGIRGCQTYDINTLIEDQPGVNRRYFEAAVKSHRAQFDSDPYQYGGWRAKHDPDWLPF